MATTTTKTRYLDVVKDGRVSFAEFLRWKEFAWRQRVEGGLEDTAEGAPPVGGGHLLLPPASSVSRRQSMRESSSSSSSVHHLPSVNEEGTARSGSGSGGGSGSDDPRERLGDVDVAIMRRHFDAVDQDGNGQITAAEMQCLLAALRWTDHATVEDAFECVVRA